MVEYGYINENGCLTSKILKERTERYMDVETEEVKERIVTVEEQALYLSELGWKPVEPIDESKLECPDYYSVRFTPYDAGDRIRYNYEQRFDYKGVQKIIDKLKDSLTSNDSEIGDYRITKCYEASLMGLNMPYDMTELHQKRQSVRDEINRLEKLILSNT